MTINLESTCRLLEMPYRHVDGEKAARGNWHAMIRNFKKRQCSHRRSRLLFDREGRFATPCDSDLSLFSHSRIEVFANYIDLKLEPNKGLFQYEVKFTPDIDSRLLRRKLLNQHSADLGHTKTFDGTTLYLPIRLPQDVSLHGFLVFFLLFLRDQVPRVGYVRNEGGPHRVITIVKTLSENLLRV